MKVVLTLVTVAAGLVCVSRLLAQQDSDRAPHFLADARTYAQLAKAPQKSRARSNPLGKDADAPAAGRILFEQHCVECHGISAEGGKKGPSLRVAQVQSAEPGAVFWLLTNGVVRRGMPVWSKLPEPQRWQLVTFIKSLGVAEPTPGPAPSDAAPKAPSPHR